MTSRQKDILDHYIYVRDSNIICLKKNQADTAHPITAEEYKEWVRIFQNINQSIKTWLATEGIEEKEATGCIYSTYGLYVNAEKLMEG